MNKTEPSMMLVSGNWGPYKTFKMIPITLYCPYIEAIFDPSTKMLAIVSKDKKPTYHFVAKLDENGDTIPMKIGRRINGKDFKEQRIMIDTYQEYYLNNLNEIKLLIENFAVNSKNYDYEKIMNMYQEELEKVSEPMSLDMATNLQLVE